MEAMNYPPHLTFAIYDEIDVAGLCATFDTAFGQLDRQVVRFESLGYFEAPNAIILWAAPVLSAEVLEVHTHIHSLVDVDLCRPHYRPASWVPHCSLALSIDLAKRDEAIALAKQSIEPVEVVFDVADCVSFLPVQVLRERELAAPSCFVD